MPEAKMQFNQHTYEQGKTSEDSLAIGLAKNPKANQNSV